jgi:hypothetical protein
MQLWCSHGYSESRGLGCVPAVLYEDEDAVSVSKEGSFRKAIVKRKAGDSLMTAK